MAVKIGTVSTFADVKPDKAQAVKIIEESAEVFSAWEQWRHWCNLSLHQGMATSYSLNEEYRKLVIECADVIQATCNFLAAFGVNDLTAVLDRCKQKNIERGREYERNY